ncbi:hypothetical protein TNCV_1278241 [Trichonephila clavipes]|nr:hypothetical protein TNCV_1278241 [Trichonephila clavipes]
MRSFDVLCSEALQGILGAPCKESDFLSNPDLRKDCVGLALNPLESCPHCDALVHFTPLVLNQVCFSSFGNVAQNWMTNGPHAASKCDINVR